MGWMFRRMVLGLGFIGGLAWAGTLGEKPSPDEVLMLLKEGNQRFVKGQSANRHRDAARLQLAGTENQGNHALATIISCSDSRVPVELIFDAGIMDLFVIRVAGNVCDTDEIGSIEYGLAHVHTPVLVVLGHTQCGAVTAVTHTLQGRGHRLERNIPPLVDNIIPAVETTKKAYPKLKGDALIAQAIVENVFQGIEDVFRESPSVRQLVHSGKAKVVGAIYDVGQGTIEWLSDQMVAERLAKVEQLTDKALDPLAPAH
jgi:carbonic anhydrase